MPPRARAPKPSEDDGDVARHAKADGEICPQCWPAGWPDDQSGAACQHGQWTR